MGRRSDIDGRELLLAAALSLFATHGVDGVSIRAVNREAGLGPGSVHYHFGTKEALIDAVLASYGQSVVDALRTRAEEIATSDDPRDARDLVSMLAGPYLDLMDDETQTGQNWVRLVGQVLQTDPNRALDHSSAKLTWRAAASVYPDAAPASVERAMRMCFSLLITQLGQIEHGRLDLGLLVDFLSAGLDAALRSPASDARTSLSA